MALKGYRRHFEPRPVAWGFKDTELISQAIEAITADDGESASNNEWEILYQLKGEINKLPTDNEVSFFDKNLNKISL